LIIPARDEEKNLARLFTSINELSIQPSEIIVVDDHSTDRTADVARAAGATVHPAPPLPAGWRGKTWACWHGAQKATGNTLLFLDADTLLQPQAIQRIQQAYEGRKVLSLGPWHAVEQPYEQLSAVFNLMMFMGMGSFSLFGSPDDPRGLFGPFLLIDRDVYFDVGGHEAVRGEILEHMTLCQRLRERNIPMRCLGGRDTVHFRMYPDGFSSLVEGWTKAFAAGASKTEPMTLMLTVAWMTGGMLAFIFTLLDPIYLITYGAYVISFYRMLGPIGRFSIWSCIFYPGLLVAFFIIFGRSALRRRRGDSVTWKGRTIDTAAGGESSSRVQVSVLG
ncbi:MAG: glycosyltransferase, partial [Verrucomicrobiota bacterium]